jgi:hypothetical protein
MAVRQRPAQPDGVLAGRHQGATLEQSRTERLRGVKS